jgi:hypothetical protein
MDHFTVEDAGGLMPGLHSSARGRPPCGFLIPKYVNTVGSAAKSQLSFCAYRFDGDGSQELYGHAFLMPEVGDAWRNACARRSPTISALTQGECLPRATTSSGWIRPEKMPGDPRAARQRELRREREGHGRIRAKTSARFSTR